MTLSGEQIKGRIRNIAKANNADARSLLRIFMMERFLERVSQSKYADNFIIKGGVLVTSMVGVSMRSTMDIDTTIRNISITDDEVGKIIEEISLIDSNDNVKFTVGDMTHIMDEMEYPGIRCSLVGLVDQIIVPIKIDISTGDAITPREIAYDYKLMLEDRSIKIWTYNLETVLAEKLQTILSRGTANTRMRDYYDIYILLASYRNKINTQVLKNAFDATCLKRRTSEIAYNTTEIIDKIVINDYMKELWEQYRNKFSYAIDITYNRVCDSLIDLVSMLE